MAANIPSANRSGFSELVDEAVAIAGAGDPSSLNTTINYLRLTIREVEKQALFARNSAELSIPLGTPPTGSQSDSYDWPLPLRFRRVHVAEYFNLGVDVKFMRPGALRERDTRYHYYATPSQYTFNGLTGASELRLFYFLWSRNFVYYPVNERPAYFDLATESWFYLNNTGSYVPSLGDPVAEALAESLVSNFLILDWRQVVTEGALAKLFKARGDNNRSVTSFSLYKEGQKAVIATEKFYREDDI